MTKFESFLEVLKQNILDMADKELQEFKLAAVMDGITFTSKLRADLLRWNIQYANGDISRDEYEWLLEGKKDLAEMEFLKQQGLAQVRLDNFVNSLITMIVSTAITAL